MRHKRGRRVAVRFVLRFAAVFALFCAGAPAWAGDADIKLTTNDGSTTMTVQDSAGTTVFSVNSDGGVAVATTVPRGFFHVSSTWTTNMAVIGDTATLILEGNNFTSIGKNVTNPISNVNSLVYNVLEVSPYVTQNLNESAAWTGYVAGMDTQVSMTGSGNVSGLVGLSGGPVYSGNGTLTDGVYGVSAWPRVKSGTMPDLMGVMSQAYMDGGTVTNVRGLYVKDVSKTGGTITNNYGLSVGGLVAGTNNYAVHTNQSSGANKYALYNAGAAASYFAGNVGIGTTAPGTKLHMSSGTLLIDGSGAGFKYVDGNQGTNKVLTSDAAGGGTWQSVTSAEGNTYTSSKTFTQSVGIGAVGLGSGNGGATLVIASTTFSNAAGKQYSVLSATFTITPSAGQAQDGTVQQYGGRTFAYIPTSNANTIGEAYGFLGFAENYGSGSVRRMDGINSWVYNKSANVTTSIHATGNYAQSDAGTITGDLVGSDVYLINGGTINGDYAAFKVLDMTNTGTVANRYGLYLGAFTNGGTITNDYGIYQGGSAQKNYFAGKVGIGTTTPSAMLHVLGNTANQLYIDNVSAPNGESSIGYRQNGVLKMQEGMDNNCGAPPCWWVVDTDAQYSLLVSSTGNIGIGTTSPGSNGALLEVAQTTTVSAAGNYVLAGSTYTINPSADQPSSPAVQQRALEGYVVIPAASTRRVNWISGVLAQAENYGSGAVGYMSGLDTWVWNKSGANVDVLRGTTGDVESDGGLAGEMTAVNAWGGAYGGTVTGLYGFRIEGLDNSGATVTNRYGLYMPAFTGTATNDYGVYQAGSLQKNYFAGSVSVGGATTRSTFTTTGNLQLVSGSTITSNGTLTISTAASAATATAAIFIDRSGYVGISSNAPTQKLEVFNGNIAVHRFDGGRPQFFIQFDNTNTSYGMGIQNDGRLHITDEADFGANTASGINIPSNGNVGIGTTGPVTTLEVNGDAQFGTGVTKSTFTTTAQLAMGAGLRFYSRTIAQLRAITPASVGETYYCSNCSPAKLVVSTGTAAANFADAAGGTFK